MGPLAHFVDRLAFVFVDNVAAAGEPLTSLFTSL